MHKLLYFTFALMSAFGQVTVDVAARPAANTANVALAAVGMTLGDGILPCVGLGGIDCYGVPPNNVVVQPVSFITPNTTPIWYAVYQTNGWTGTLTATFSLIEKGSVVQTATQSAIADGGASVIMITTPQAVPTNGYVGPVTFTVTTTAMPTGGGMPGTLKSGILLQMVAAPGGTGKTVKVTQVMAGSLQALGSGSPCVANVGYPCFGTPVGTVVFQPSMFLMAPSQPTFFAVFQAAYPFRGGASAQIQLTEAGTAVATLGEKIGLASNGIMTVMISGGVNLPGNGYVGPAVLTGTAVATSNSGATINLKSSVVGQIVP